MRYRSTSDRRVSAYIALLTITVMGSIATLLILHAIRQVDFMDLAIEQVASGTP